MSAEADTLPAVRPAELRPYETGFGSRRLGGRGGGGGGAAGCKVTITGLGL